MKSEFTGQYLKFLNNMSSKILSMQESFSMLKNSMANLIQNLPEEEKDTFILKYNQISEAFESIFNRYNRGSR